MAFKFYVVMQKRADGKVYADLHKTDGRIYYTEEDASRALLLDHDLAKYRHVVPMVAETEADWDAKDVSAEV